MQLNPNLIFDIGMHKGEDTKFYLKNGYSVVAVEANPVLARECEAKFKSEIESGRLTIVNVGIAEEEGEMPFYVNKHSSEWSSFDREIGTRNNTPFEIINIKTVRTRSLFEKYGCPYYLKVDIEGFDYLAIKDIQESLVRPQYVSCESNEVEWLDILHQKGYRKFKLINQANNFRPLNTSLEGKNWYITYRRVKHSFKDKMKNILPSRYVGGSSGPFGEETKGEWKSYEEVRKSYLTYKNGKSGKPLNNISWCDFHASL